MAGKDKISITVIGSHMDDCWLGAGGTAIKAARQGHRVTFVTAISNYRYWPVTKGRESEIHPYLEDVCRRNGIELISLGHDYMRLVNTPELVGEISLLLKKIGGDILFCHAEDEDNQDHTALGAACRIAALHGECFTDDRNDMRPWEIYQYTTGWQARTFRPDTFVDVSETLYDALTIINRFDEFYCMGPQPNKRITVMDHTQGDRTLTLNDHARHKFAQAISFGAGCYAEGFTAYTRQCISHSKLAMI